MAAMQRRRRSNTLSNVALGSALVAVSLALAIMWLAKDPSATPSHRPALATEAESDPSHTQPGDAVTAQSAKSKTTLGDSPRAAIRLDDGSKVLALGTGQVRLVAQTETEASFRLERGKAWFDVKPSTTRTIVVRIADVRVQVLGTEFVVEKQGEEVFVWVQRGTATVSSRGQELTLRENERASFPAHNAPLMTEADLPLVVPAESMSANKKSRAEASPPIQHRSVVELWSIADSARLNGKLGPAIEALDALVKQYPKDARAALAAFTLGRILLEAKANPRRAAAAFEKARTLSPRAPLVEDALSREIDSLRQAGASALAKQRTELYEQLFPNGRHIERIRNKGTK
jgi:transmembrane sensor